MFYLFSEVTIHISNSLLTLIITIIIIAAAFVLALMPVETGIRCCISFFLILQDGRTLKEAVLDKGTEDMIRLIIDIAPSMVNVYCI